MIVRDIIRLVKLKLGNLALTRDEESILVLINLGVSELYRRFNLAIKSETIPTNSNLSLYELRNEDVLLLLGVYNHLGKELRQLDTIGDNEYDYKIVNYRSFILRKPVDGYVYALYKGSPIPLKDENDMVDLPVAMIDALLAYISHIGHSTINKDNMNEASMWYQRFETACQLLDMQGYKIPLHIETLPIQAKGFV